MKTLSVFSRKRVISSLEFLHRLKLLILMSQWIIILSVYTLLFHRLFYVFNDLVRKKWAEVIVNKLGKNVIILNYSSLMKYKIVHTWFPNLSLSETILDVAKDKKFKVLQKNIKFKVQNFIAGQMRLKQCLLN
jgi:hypothetical protein